MRLNKKSWCLPTCIGESNPSEQHFENLKTLKNEVKEEKNVSLAWQLLRRLIL